MVLFALLTKKKKNCTGAGDISENLQFSNKLMPFWQNSPCMPFLLGRVTNNEMVSRFLFSQSVYIRFDVAVGSQWLSNIQGSMCCKDHLIGLSQRLFSYFVYVWEIFKRFGSLFIWGTGWSNELFDRRCGRQCISFQRLALWFHFADLSIYLGSI